MDRIDPIDLRLLDGFQRDLPLVPRPFAAVGVRVGLEEAEVIARLSRMQSDGRISRVGATVRPNTAGASTLAAMAVPEDRIEEVAALVGAEPGVNHSYLREADWNLWFVATAPDANALDAMLRRIDQRTRHATVPAAEPTGWAPPNPLPSPQGEGEPQDARPVFDDPWANQPGASLPPSWGREREGGLAARTEGPRLLDLRLVRPFNIDLGFPLAGRPVAMPSSRGVQTAILRPEDRPLLDALSQGLDLVPRPFAALARRLARNEAEVTARVAVLLAAGILTRLGVIVRHRALGFTANAMVVWDVPALATVAGGLALAALPGVTLAYERRPVPGIWPYRLYCMIHARSRPEALVVLDRARALPALQGADHRVLFSTRCFKQSGARLSEAA